MRDYNHYSRQEARTGATGPADKQGMTVYTAEQREIMQQGLRILARIIARAHLRRGSSCAESAPSPDRGLGG